MGNSPTGMRITETTKKSHKRKQKEEEGWHVVVDGEVKLLGSPLLAKTSVQSWSFELNEGWCSCQTTKAGTCKRK